MDEENLAELVEQARAGQTRAYDTLVRRFQDAAVGYASALLDDHAAASDAAQNAFVEAYHCLPTLREPLAFPGWLRRIVFKHCDRIRRARRPTVPLDAAQLLAGPADDPMRRVLDNERAALVHAAVAALPPAERAVVHLFYLADSGHAAIAAFLGVPATTVKSRLHAARKRLRKELPDLMENNTLKNERPSRDEKFAGRVLAEIVAEYEGQRRADPHTASRALLADARARLNEALVRPPLTPQTVQAGSALLSRLRDFDAQADLLTRYRAQSLSVSHEAWARWGHIWALTMAERAAETLAAQTEFCRWADETFAHETPRLSAHQPYDPLDNGDAGEALEASALPIWVLGIPQQAHLWRDADRAGDWLRLAENALTKAGKTPGNRLHRFHLLRTIALIILPTTGRINEARATVSRIAAIADEETDPIAAERWRLEERTTRMHFDADHKNADAVRAVGLDVIPRLGVLEERFHAAGELPPGWLQTFAHNAACSLASAKAYELAIPLFEKVIAGGRGTGYAYLRLASAVWADGNRPRTLALLREAGAREDRDLIPLLRNLPEFAGVLDDPDFVAAAAKRP